MVIMGLPRMGTLPGTSNEPQGMRQETASGHTQRVSLFSHQGIPLWDFQPATRPACMWEEGRWVSRAWRKLRKGSTGQVWVYAPTSSGDWGIVELGEDWIRVSFRADLAPKHSDRAFFFQDLWSRKQNMDCTI